MNLELFHERRRLLRESEPKTHHLCARCLQPGFGCYCSHVKPFDPAIEFVVLIHPIEVKRRIATGRMSHLCLQGSSLIVGEDYSQNRRVNEIIERGQAAGDVVVLYPGKLSIDLTPMPMPERARLFPGERKLTVFVIDGTWATARKMARSANIAALPRICFSPEKPSRFRVRKQPGVACYSTIEAIHHTIELLGPARGLDVESRRHDVLLDVFDVMVERQLRFIREVRANRQAAYRRERKRDALSR